MFEDFVQENGWRLTFNFFINILWFGELTLENKLMAGEGFFFSNFANDFNFNSNLEVLVEVKVSMVKQLMGRRHHTNNTCKKDPPLSPVRFLSSLFLSLSRLVSRLVASLFSSCHKIPTCTQSASGHVCVCVPISPFPQQHLLFGPVFLVLALKFSHTQLKDGILRIAHLQFLAEGLTRESHHSLTCADFATDQQMAEHTKECRNTLQRRGFLPHFCCIDVLTAFAGSEPKARNHGSRLWSD